MNSDTNIYSEEAFESSRFSLGERVRFIIRHPVYGHTIKEAEGTLAGRQEDMTFETPEGEERTKTLVWLKDIDGYEKPNPNVPGATQKVDDAWFSEDAIRKLEAEPEGVASMGTRDPLDGISFN